MHRLQSIRSRILAGFVAMLLLQIGVAVAVWQAENEVEVTSAQDSASAARSGAMRTVMTNLRMVQWRLAEYVRTGMAGEQEQVVAALATLGKAIGEAGASSGSGANLSASIQEVEASLGSVVKASIARRGASAALVQAATDVQNALTSLVQAATRAPDRTTLETAALATTATTHPLAAAHRYAFNENPVDGNAVRTSVGTVKDILSGLTKEGANPTPRIQRLVGVTAAALDGLLPSVQALDAATAERTSSLVNLNTTVTNTTTMVSQLSDAIAVERLARRQEMDAARHAVRTTVTSAVVVAGLFGVGLAFWVGQSITRPINRLRDAMSVLAGGAFETEVPDTMRRDEVGGMARAVQVFKDNGLRARTLEAEAATARQEADAERARNEAERASLAEEQATVVAELARGLAGLASGDLTGRVHAFPEEYRKLESDFNAAIGSLQDTITVIAGNGQGIRSGSGEISQSADDLSKRTEQQAASLEETAAALDEITATVRKTAEGANHAREVVLAAKADAERSSQVVQQAVTAMSAIDKSAKEISQIIGVIDEIAFQTNLLALNAGVEAARAGEAGKGFAVVASEVRALAQRSADAAKEIKGLISTSSTQVTSGVSLVGETGKALSRIAAQVAELNGIVSEIASSAQEQAVGLAQVNTAVNQMDQMTQQNAAMVEESTAASHSLAGEAEQLATLIGRFRTGNEAEDATHAPSAPRRAPSRAAQADTAARPAIRLVASSGLAVKHTAPASDEWEEF